jgi:succinyl-diaminopimelate desuccinylase
MQSAEHLLSAAQSFQSQLTCFLQDLIRIPSVNGKDSEGLIADRIIEEAKILRLDSCLAAKDPYRPNVLVSIGKGKKGFLLIAHMDTVPIGDPTKWTYPPFSAEMKHGLIFGRGSADNKAGIACSLYTLALLRDMNFLDLDNAKVIFAGVVDEESGASSTLGMRYLLEQKLLPVEASIYTYTSDIICIGHRGLLRLELVSKGETIHTGSEAWSRKEGGINAVTALSSVLLKLEKLRFSYPLNPAFQHLNCTITPGTTIQGGEWEGMVPAFAKATVDIRMMPGQTSIEILNKVQSIIKAEIDSRPGLRIEYKVTVDLPAAEIPLDHRLVLTTKEVAQSISGHEWVAKGAGPANEGYMLIRAGIPTLCGFGAKGGNPHAPDEWVEIASLSETIAIYAGIIQKYLTNS